MRRIKIFTDCDEIVVEQRVNDWLAQHKAATIHEILQSECDIADGPWSLTITIFYYEGEGHEVI